MSSLWNERYAQNEYVYGKQPNDFFKEQLLHYQPGNILLPAEGEGRNAVFAAKQGWTVSAFDSSLEAKKKAEKLASENGVQINYSLNSFEDFQSDKDNFDLIALIYAHNSNRQINHQKLIKFLKPGRTILLEAFSKNQINNTTGGPTKIEMLFSKEELSVDFNELSELYIWEEDRLLEEGKYHSGKASIIRLIGKK